MDAKWRFGTTLFIWVFCFILAILALIGAASGAVEGWVFFVPLVTAMFATLPIWESGKDDSPEKSASKQASSKADNTAYTMALLMEMMDEDEREQFKYDLKRRILSGEAITNESLIEDMEKRKRS